MRTLFALIAAVAMVAGGLYVRGALDGEGSGSPLAGGELPRVICATELAAACNALNNAGLADVRIQEAGGTAGALISGEESSVDAWLTLAPWPAIVAEARQRQGAPPLSDASPQPALARSPLVFVFWQDRGAALAERCRRASFSWSCVGRAAGGRWEDFGGDPRWGEVKPGHADPSLNATGLLVLGQAVSDRVGTTDFSLRDLDADDGFLTWFSDLERAVPDFGSAGSTPLQRMLTLGRAGYDIIGTTEAEAGPALERASDDRVEDLIMRPSTPPVVAEVVLAPLQPGDVDMGALITPIRQALAQDGWRVEGEPLAPGITAAAPSGPGNWPSAGVLDALRARWEEVTR